MSSPEQIARIRISLQEIEPEIWRLVEVPLGVTLKGLHDVIQAAFGWEDCHLFEFRVGEKLYGLPDPEEDFGRKVMHAKSAKLRALIARGIDRFDYAYDFGDNWRHRIEIESIGPVDPTLTYPRFISGARRGPPEDVGGFPGYFRFLDAISHRRHPEHRRLIEWYGGPYDPDDIGLSEIRMRMAWIAGRREAGKAAYLKSRGGR